MALAGSLRGLYTIYRDSGTVLSMAVWKVQTTLKTVDAIPANYLSNTIYVEMDFSQVNVDAVVDRIKDFYDALEPTVLGSALAIGPHVTKWYAVPGTTPNYPQYESEWSLASVPNEAGLPSEVALVLSFQGERVPGIEQNRRRGRIYLGPLQIGMNTSGRPTSTRITTIVNAAKALGDGIASDTGGNWVVWSGTSGVSTEVKNGWVDNAFDTQRRRGVDATSRSEFVLA